MLNVKVVKLKYLSYLYNGIRYWSCKPTLSRDSFMYICALKRHLFDCLVRLGRMAMKIFTKAWQGKHENTKLYSS